MWEREFEFGNKELLDVGTTNVIRLFELDDAKNLPILRVSSRVGVKSAWNTYVNRPETSTVSGSHILVQRLDSVRARELAELLVHVVRA